MDSNKIIIVGSTNMDMVVKAKHIPVPGETILGGSFLMTPGGKGANQAVAVARLGGKAHFISKIGDDIFGKKSTEILLNEGVNTEGLLLDKENPSGVALITVDQSGENSIVVASGANGSLAPQEVEKQLNSISGAGILLVQLEIPMETVKFTVKQASSLGIKVILNTAPANPEVEEVFSSIDIITPNTNEAEVLTGIAVKDIDSAQKAATALHDKGIKTVILTMGKEGALLSEEGNFTLVPAPKVEAVDTTAAGDVFNGALAVSLAEGKSLQEAVEFACKAAALTVTKMGAQSSIPFREKVN